MQRNVENLISAIEATKTDNKALLVFYWATYNNVLSCLNNYNKIPDNVKREVIALVLRSIIEQGTNPETIMRTKRHIVERNARYGKS